MKSLAFRAACLVLLSLSSGRTALAEPSRDPFPTGTPTFDHGESLLPSPLGLSGQAGAPGPGLASVNPLHPLSGEQWSLVVADTMARGGHSAIHDPVGNRMIVFGGSRMSGLLNDVWAYSLAGPGSWSAMTTAGTPPSARYLHAAVYDEAGQRMIVFGGADGASRNDVWALTLGGTPTWSQLSPAGTAPAGRYAASAIYDPAGDRVIVFGGVSGTSSALGDVWQLALGGSPAWSQLTPGGSPITPRHGHTAVCDTAGSRMIVFGGAGAAPGGKYSALKECWAMSLEGSPVWTQLTLSGSLPEPRVFHSAVYDGSGQRMLVFGGSVNDLWSLSLGETPAWSAVSAASPPSGRNMHSAILDPGASRMILFGGTSSGLMGDVWSLSLTPAFAWSEVTPHPMPSPTFLHTSVYDSAHDRIVVFGGRSATNDVWVLPLGASPLWQRLATAGTPPSPRSGHSAIYDPAGEGRMIVYGGNSGNAQVWELTLGASPTWSLLSPGGTAPAGRTSHTAVFDPTSVSSPNPTTALIEPRIFNDCPTSSLTTMNGYPSQITIEDANVDCFGFANLHVWTLSEDGLNELVFDNPDPFRLAMDFKVEGTGDGEGGLRISPWWSHDADGVFNVRSTDGEIACFGGRLPFFSFTTSHGLSYVKGTVIRLEAIYDPHSLSEADPGTIEYRVRYNGTDYSSGVLPFDQGNPGEDPPYGLWGILNDARLGGHFKVFAGQGAPVHAKATFSNVAFAGAGGRMIVFGGTGTGGTALSDAWALSLGASPGWSLIVTSGQSPGPRAAHSAVADPPNHRMVVFGGNNNEKKKGSVADNGIYALSLDTGVWTRLVTMGTAPDALTNHAAVRDPGGNGRMIVFGGHAIDMWSLDLGATPAWTALSPAGPAPAPRGGSAAVYAPSAPGMIVFGGAASGGYVNDTWLLSTGFCNTPVVIAPPAAVSVGAGQAASFSVAASGTAPLSYQWLRVNPITSTLDPLPPDPTRYTGETTATLTYSNVATCDWGLRVCRITNACGTFSTSPVQLDVQPAQSPPPRVHQWGEPGSGPGQFSTGYKIALDPDDVAYVLDLGNFRIQKFSPSGVYQTEWHVASDTVLADISHPTGIACDAAGNVYVANHPDHRIEKYSPTGQLLLQWGSLGTGNGQFNGPLGITVDNQDRVYVTDYLNGRVVKFDHDGNYLAQWPAQGLYDIAVAPSGKVYTCGGGGIFEYDTDGTLLASRPIDDSCTDGAIGSYPIALEVDACGRVVVADRINHRVQMFGPDLTWLRNWGHAGTDDDGFVLADGIAVGHTGNVYVMDNGRARVTAWSVGFAPPCDSCAGSAPIRITSQSGSQVVEAGQTLVLSVAATGPGVLSYRWKRNDELVADGANVSGQFTAALELLHAEPASAGSYQAEVFNACNTVATVPAIVQVVCPGVPAPAPPRLGAWWTFDHPAGPTATRDLAHLATQVNVGTLLSGASIVPGRVGRALRCVSFADGMRVTPSGSSILFGNQGFAIDAWVYLRPGSPAGAVRMIATRGRKTDAARIEFYVRDGHLVLKATRGGSMPLLEYQTTTAPVTSGVWHHVAVSVTPILGRGRFYVDGVEAQYFVTPMFGVVNSADLYVGRCDPTYGSSSPDSAFNGDIDELQIFRPSHDGRDSTVIRKIWAAGCNGTRQEFVRLPLQSNLCSSGTASCAQFTNYGSIPQTYNWDIGRMPASGACPIAAPLLFSPTIASVTVPPGGTVTVPIAIGTPPTYWGPVNTCFRLVATNVSTGNSFFTESVAMGAARFCLKAKLACQLPELLAQADSPDATRRHASAAQPASQVFGPATTQAEPGRFTITNDEDTPLQFVYAVRAVDAETGESSELVSVEGLPAGMAFEDTVTVPAHDSLEVDVTVAVDGNDPFLMDQLVLSADVDGDAVPEDLVAAPIEALEDTVGAVTGVAPSLPALGPNRVQAFPNPFLSRTWVRFTLSEARDVEVRVFDVAGRQIHMLHRGRLDAGEHGWGWDGRNSRGGLCGPGIYFVRVESTGLRMQTKIVQIQ